MGLCECLAQFYGKGRISDSCFSYYLLKYCVINLQVFVRWGVFAYSNCVWVGSCTVRVTVCVCCGRWDAMTVSQGGYVDFEGHRESDLGVQI